MSDLPENIPAPTRDSADQDQFIYFRLYRRSCFEWAGWLAWLVVELFVLQNAIASGMEYERRPAFLYWVFFSVLLLAGVVTYIMRRIMIIERQQSIDDWEMDDSQEDHL